MFDTYKAVLQCLCNQFQAAIHLDYLAELDDPGVGLTNLITSSTSQKMMENNKAKVLEPMDYTKLLVVCIEKQATYVRNLITMADMVQTQVTHAMAMDLMKMNIGNGNASQWENTLEYVERPL